MIPMTQTELDELVAELRKLAEAAPMQSARAELARLAADYAAKATSGHCGVAIRRRPGE